MEYQKWKFEKIANLLPDSLSMEDSKKIIEFWKKLDWIEAVDPVTLTEKLGYYQQFLIVSNLAFSHNDTEWQPLSDHFLLYPPKYSAEYFDLVCEVIGKDASVVKYGVLSNASNEVKKAAIEFLHRC